MLKTKGSWYPSEVIIQAVYLKLRFSLSYRDIEEILKDRGLGVDHATIQRWVKTAAKRFLAKAIKRNSKPSIINIDKSGANTAGIVRYNKIKQKRIKIRRCKYLNNIVQQDQRFIKRITRPILGFKIFVSAAITSTGIEIVRMLRKGQCKATYMDTLTLPERFRLSAA